MADAITRSEDSTRYKELLLSSRSLSLKMLSFFFTVIHDALHTCLCVYKTIFYVKTMFM